ncbi:MAG: hypothetical protein D6820_04085 [Lentisphaerae bacterium]|nr:MAG: hypothetical protein D6820_04085 [Lentisphaerota bacterium]
MRGKVSEEDKNILRELAKKVAELAARPEMEERKRLWTEHNDLKLRRPLILVFPEGSWQELLPAASREVEEEGLWPVERELKRRIYTAEHLGDDSVIVDEWPVTSVVRQVSGWGLEEKRVPSPEQRGAWHYEPVLHSAADVARLRIPELYFDETATKARVEFFEELFGDILKVRYKGVHHITYHLMKQYTSWRGLEEMMMDIYCNPQLIHDVMEFLVEAHSRILEFYREHNLLRLNNDNTYQGSGGNGWTRSLPADDFSGVVRPQDMWSFAESQELAQVGPEHHNQFALAYEKRLLAPFGLTAYGCCEDLSRKLDYVCTIPNLRRISISPWADVEIAAAGLQDRYIFSWKPNPAHLVGRFDPEMIRSYIRHTLEVAKEHGCILELVLKDTHTCDGEPERFSTWTRIAREEITRVYG